LIRYRASWIVPIAGPPIPNGWVIVDGGRIAALGHSASPDQVDVEADVDLGSVAILPGLVNAHTHLELSYLRDKVPPGPDFVTWIRGVVAARRTRADPRAPEILEALERAIQETVQSGTAVVGDISNTLVPFEALARSPLAATVFYELIRFNSADADGFVDHACRQLDALAPTDRVRAGLAAHAPYSVAPLVFRAIRRAVDRDPFVPWSVHLAESAEETAFIRDASGPWRALLEEVGAWNPDWVAPGVSPVQYLDEAGFLDARLLAVHGVQMSAADLTRLESRGTTLVTCPRSNGHTGAGAPPLADFYRSGVRVAIGTDSLASVPDLNMFAELATIRALAPSVKASALLESATLQGARALAVDADYGTIEPGKTARLLAVAVPPATADVEEYLVSGIEPAQLRWLDT
jgi:cytosine/adenosine deaminase-related metal-dependent hydrolase